MCNFPIFAAAATGGVAGVAWKSEELRHFQSAGLRDPPAALCVPYLHFPLGQVVPRTNSTPLDLIMDQDVTQAARGTANLTERAKEVVHSSFLLHSSLFERQKSCLGEVVQAVTDLRSKRLSYFLDQNREIIDKWEEIRKEQRKINKCSGHLFNPLKTIPIGEVVHSRLLGNLLDPDGDHDQGPLFLYAFLHQMDVPEPKQGRWMLSVESGLVDLCLWRKAPASVIVIENKSNRAWDQPNQLYRYWYERIHKPHSWMIPHGLSGQTAFQILYLVPDAGKIPSENSLTRPGDLSDTDLPERLDRSDIKVLTFKDNIAKWLECCEEKIPASNKRLLAYLQFYRELWT